MSDTTWTPDQPLRHDATDEQMMDRWYSIPHGLKATVHILRTMAPSAVRIAREFAKACVAENNEQWRRDYKQALAIANGYKDRLAAAETQRDALREQVARLTKATEKFDADDWECTYSARDFHDTLNDGDSDRIVRVGNLHRLPDTWAINVPTAGVMVDGILEVDESEWREFATKEEAIAARDTARAALAAEEGRSG